MVTSFKDTILPECSSMIKQDETQSKNSSFLATVLVGFLLQTSTLPTFWNFELLYYFIYYLK